MRFVIAIATTLSSIAIVSAQERPPRDQPRKADQPQNPAPRQDPPGVARVNDVPVDAFQPPRVWARGSHLLGAQVHASDDGRLGRFEDLVIDPASGRILYGVVSSPQPATTGRLYAVPWSAVNMADDSATNTRRRGAKDAERRAYRLNVERGRFSDAPSFEPDRWPDFSSRAWSSSVYRHYNQQPYWETNTGEARVPANRESWYRHPTSARRVSELRDIEIKNRRNQNIGKLVDVSVDPSTGRVLYGVISRGDKLYAVPWSSIALGPDRTGLIDASEEQFAEHGFTREDWPDMADRAWTDETYRRFNARPYWDEDRDGSAPRRDRDR